MILFNNRKNSQISSRFLITITAVGIPYMIKQSPKYQVGTRLIGESDIIVATRNAKLLILSEIILLLFIIIAVSIVIVGYYIFAILMQFMIYYFYAIPDIHDYL